MQENVKKYDNYKDSGIEWIGKIPEDWEVIKLGKLGRFTSSGIDKKIVEGQSFVKIINYTDVYGNNTFLLKNKDYMVVSAESTRINEHLVKDGDLIFTPSSETVEDIGISCLVSENLDNTAYSYHVLRFRFNQDVNKQYKKYLCNNHYVYNYFGARATGSIRKTLNRDDFKECSVLLPSSSEQENISDYLDKKCAKIDEIIGTEKQIIEKLKEYKQSVITEAVTKGLDKNVPMKDSGIDWIGKTPRHWDIQKLKYKFKIKKDIAGSEGFNVLSVTQKGLKIKDLSSNEGQIAMDYSKYQFVNPTDFVMNHMDLLTGWVDCSKFSGVTSPDYRVFINTDFDNCDNEYYKNIFQSCYRNKIFYGLGQGVSGLGRWRLQSDKFLNFFIPIPPIDEQKEITNFIINKSAQIDNAIFNKEQAIEKLTEYKKSLIYECVTGKRKVAE